MKFFIFSKCRSWRFLSSANCGSWSFLSLIVQVDPPHPIPKKTLGQRTVCGSFQIRRTNKVTRFLRRSVLRMEMSNWLVFSEWLPHVLVYVIHCFNMIKPKTCIKQQKNRKVSNTNTFFLMFDMVLLFKKQCCCLKKKKHALDIPRRFCQSCTIDRGECASRRSMGPTGRLEPTLGRRGERTFWGAPESLGWTVVFRCVYNQYLDIFLFETAGKWYFDWILSTSRLLTYLQLRLTIILLLSVALYFYPIT